MSRLSCHRWACVALGLLLASNAVSAFRAGQLFGFLTVGKVQLQQQQEDAGQQTQVQPASDAADAPVILGYPSYPGQPGGDDGGHHKKKHHHSPPYPSYPGWPTWGPSPTGKGALPFSSGMIVNLQSHVLGLYCNVGPDDDKPANTLRCSEEAGVKVNEGLLIVGQDYTTQMVSSSGPNQPPILYDGDAIMLKSNRDNKVCRVGAAEDRFPILCDQPFTSEATRFVIRRAKARDDLFYIAPADRPNDKCYPARAAPDHGLEHGVGSDAEAGDDSSSNTKARHVMRCDGDHRGDNALLHITQAPYWQQDPAAAAEAATDKATTGDLQQEGQQLPMVAYPPWPGGPTGPTPPGPHHGDILPFTTGSTIQLSDPRMDALVCDTKDAGYGPSGWEGHLTAADDSSDGDDDDDDADAEEVDDGNEDGMVSVGKKKKKKDTKKKDKKKDEEKKKKKKEKKKKQKAARVKCDRQPPEGPGAAWIPAGFLVLGDDPSLRELHSGAAVYLSSQQAHKFCRPATSKDLVDGVLCDADKGAGTKFQVFLAGKHHHRHGKHGHKELASSWEEGHDDQYEDADEGGWAVHTWQWLTHTLAPSSWWDHSKKSDDHTDASGSSNDQQTVEVYLLHVDLDRYCGVDRKTKHALLMCDYGHHKPPTLLLKTNKGWPGADGTATA